MAPLLPGASSLKKKRRAGVVAERPSQGGG